MLKPLLEQKKLNCVGKILPASALMLGSSLSMLVAFLQACFNLLPVLMLGLDKMVNPLPAQLNGISLLMSHLDHHHQLRQGLSTSKEL